MAMVKKLREMTGSPIADCKSVLEAEGGDLAKAQEVLRKKGLAQAAKKMDRAAREGVIAVAVNEERTRAALAEVNCETDFVAKTSEFLSGVENILSTCLVLPKTQRIIPGTQGYEEQLASFLKETQLSGSSSLLNEYLQLLISKLKENVKVRKVIVDSVEDGVFGYYCHRTYVPGIGLKGALVKLRSEAKDREALVELADSLAMQVAAARPSFLLREEVPNEVLDKEREIVREAMKDTLASKPENVAKNIVEGKLKKYFEDNVLSLQQVVFLEDQDDKRTVAQFLKEKEKELDASIKIESFLYAAVGVDS